MAAEEHPITANPDVFEYDLSGECDFILMGCDGIWETKSNDVMGQWIYNKLETIENKTTEALRGVVSDLLNELVSPNHQ